MAKTKMTSDSPLAPRTAPRPPSRPIYLQAPDEGTPPHEDKKGKPRKMASGGKCRGMGAAVRGGSYKAR